MILVLNQVTIEGTKDGKQTIAKNFVNIISISWIEIVVYICNDSNLIFFSIWLTIRLFLKTSKMDTMIGKGRKKSKNNNYSRNSPRVKGTNWTIWNLENRVLSRLAKPNTSRSFNFNQYVDHFPRPRQSNHWAHCVRDIHVQRSSHQTCWYMPQNRCERSQRR